MRSPFRTQTILRIVVKQIFALHGQNGVGDQRQRSALEFCMYCAIICFPIFTLEEILTPARIK